MVDDDDVLEMANSLKADDPKIMTMLAKGNIKTKRAQEGANVLERVMKLTKGNIDDDPKGVMADVYIESGKYREAADMLKELLDKKSDTPTLLKYAKALTYLEKYDDATKVIETIKATDPENIEAHMLMGKVKVMQKKYDEAVETYKEVLYINAEYAPALTERANVYLIQNKVQWAKTFL